MEVKDISKLLTWSSSAATASTKKADDKVANMTLDEIATKIAELRPALADLLEELDENPRSENYGLSFLDLKTQLQISYLANLCYYLLLKVSNETVKDHPVLNDLYFIRSLSEKIRPIDERLRYRVEKLLNADEVTAPTAEENMRPDVDALMSSIVDSEDEDGDEEEVAKVKNLDTTLEGDDKYVVPKFSSVEYTGDHVSNAAKANKELDRQAARLRKSEFVRSMREELTDAPAEIGGEEKMDKSYRNFKAKLAHREEYELENMTRLPMSKADKKELKHMRHLAKTGKHRANVMSLTEFAEVDSFLQDLPAEGPGNKKKKGKKNVGGSALKGFRHAQAQAKEAASVLRKAAGGKESTKKTKKHRKRPLVNDMAF
eukprot:gene71-349_t